MHQQLGDLTPVAPFSLSAGWSWTVPTMRPSRSATSKITPSRGTPAHQSRATSAGRGAWKPSDAPWATQEISTSVRSSSSLAESRSTRRIDAAGCEDALLTLTARATLATIRHAGTDGAETEDRQMIDGRRKTVAGADAVSQRIDQGIIQLQDRAAAVADQVMMQIVDQLELPGPAAEVGHAHQPQIAEQLQRAVDRRAVDPRQERLDPGEDLVGGEMLTRSERRQDDQPLRRDALPDAAQPVGQTARADRFFRTVHAISFEVHQHPIAVV